VIHLLNDQFYFIKDEYFNKYDKEHKLLRNKENSAEHARPCLFVFLDKNNKDIMWVVPISSQVEKYTNIANHKIQKMMGKGEKKCDQILFGKVLGSKRAFLIQNMFPITKEYIQSIYIDKQTKCPVNISKDTMYEVQCSAKRVLGAALSGRNKYAVFSDISATRKELINELRTKEIKRESDIGSEEFGKNKSKAMSDYKSEIANKKRGSTHNVQKSKNRNMRER